MILVVYIYYDPSYGISYTSELEWEDASVEFLVYKNQINNQQVIRPDVKKRKETEFNP